MPGAGMIDPEARMRLIQMRRLMGANPQAQPAAPAPPPVLPAQPEEPPWAQAVQAAVAALHHHQQLQGRANNGRPSEPPLTTPGEPVKDPQTGGTPPASTTPGEPVKDPQTGGSKPAVSKPWWKQPFKAPMSMDEWAASDKKGVKFNRKGVDMTNEEAKKAAYDEWVAMKERRFNQDVKNRAPRSVFAEETEVKLKKKGKAKKDANPQYIY